MSKKSLRNSALSTPAPTPAPPIDTGSGYPTEDVPPFERYKRIALMLEEIAQGNPFYRDCVRDIAVMVDEYEAMIGSRNSPFKNGPKMPHGPGQKAAEEYRVEHATVNASEKMARESVQRAEQTLAGSISAYELAAQINMAVDFDRGLTLAQHAKALRVRALEMKLGAA